MVKFHEVKIEPDCPISYKVLLTVNSVGNGRRPERKSGTNITPFHCDSPFQARNEALALAEGWEHILGNEYYRGGRQYEPKSVPPEPFDKKKRGYNDYSIKVYCVETTGCGATKEFLLLDKDWEYWPLSTEGKGSYQVYKQAHVREYELYQKHGIDTAEHELTFVTSSGEEFSVIETENECIKIN